MRIIKSIEVLRKSLLASVCKGKSIGFVPTMGYFHEGHLSLMRKAKKENDICVVSLFINPTQFAPHEDFTQYPRDHKRDASMARKEKVDILFLPSDNDIYPNGYLTYVDVNKISESLCGAFRPHHFRGVATVVSKLLNIIQPQVMYLGQKDAQQVVVLKTVVRDLHFNCKIKILPTMRERDGLAMSSRNMYLNVNERINACALFQALSQVRKLIAQGERSWIKCEQVIKDYIHNTSSGKIQYVACVNATTLEPLRVLQGEVLIAVSVFFGKTRLIDNITVRV